MIVRPTGRHVPGFRQQARAAVLRYDTNSKLVLLALAALALSACENLGVHDAQSLLLPRFQRSEVFGFVAGFGTTFAALPDLIAMLRRRSIAGMNPRMAGIMGVFQVLWVVLRPLDLVAARDHLERRRDPDQLPQRRRVRLFPQPRTAANGQRDCRRVNEHDRRKLAPRRGSQRQSRLEEVGTVPQRAPVGHGPRGLQRRGRRLELLHPRPGALARLSLGRGRPGRHLRRPAAALLRARAVERQGSDPQGAAVRPDQQRGQSRRGRQGVLLLPRQHADALVHEVPLQVSAARLSLRRSRRDQQAAAATSWSTSCSTPACSTRTATSTCSSSTPRRRPRTS